MHRVVALLPCLLAAVCQVTAADQRIIQSPLIRSHERSTDLTGLHRHLVEIESISRNEDSVGDWLSSWLRDQEYSVHRQAVNDYGHNILAWPGAERDVHTLVTSHIDTVPPYYPYTMTKNGSSTVIGGRGSVDAKAAVAAQIIALNELLNAGSISPDSVALLLVVGEETGGAGMRTANELNLTPKAVIFGEPTEGKLVSGHKGIMSFKIEANGRAAHSGYPWLGRSANEVMVTCLAAIMKMQTGLPRSDKYGETTINIGTMTGGVAHNVVAERASAELTARIAAGTPKELRETIAQTIRAAVVGFGDEPDKIARVTFGDLDYGPVDIDCDVPGFECMSVNYGTDVPHLDKTVEGQKRYLYGGGSIFVAHSDHETMTVDELEQAMQGYKRLISHTLEQPGKKH